VVRPRAESVGEEVWDNGIGAETVQLLDGAVGFHIPVEVERSNPSMEYICRLLLGLHPSCLENVVEGCLDSGVRAVEGSAVTLEGRDAGAWETQVLGEDIGEDAVVKESNGVGGGEEEL